MVTRECQATHKLSGSGHSPSCYLDKEVPARRLTPQLRCLLRHRLPCKRCKVADWMPTVPGRISRSEAFFIDSTYNAVDLGNDRGRALVFTIWRDFGTGESQLDPRWLSQLQSQKNEEEWGSPNAWHREYNWGYSWLYEAYEGVPIRTMYVPDIPQHVLENLINHV
ncbi:hypothetical protein VTK26DRAFT_4632 [Humicola hyalothermophila]